MHVQAWHGSFAPETPCAVLRRYIKFASSSSFGNTFSILASAAWLPFTPVAPIQVRIWNLPCFQAPSAAHRTTLMMLLLFEIAASVLLCCACAGRDGVHG